ncbi:unnamed protein product [Malus baccata var. baccata]
MSMEHPNRHLKEFEVVCSRMTPINVDENILKMKAFPFSLLEKAKDRLFELAPGTVTSWESMKNTFLEKFFPTSRVIILRKRISGIQQSQGESFLAYYKHFKTLVASCPQHQMKEKLLIQYFYEGLLPLERQMLDASARDALVDKTPVAAKILIANHAFNAQQYERVGGREHARPIQVNEVVEGSKVQSVAACGVSSRQGYQTIRLPQLIENEGWDNVEEIIQILCGRNINKFNKKDIGSHLRSSILDLYNHHHLPHNNSNQIQDLENQAKEMGDMKNQIGQIVEFMGQFREQGKLPSSTIVNPNGGFETAKAITLRSVKKIGTNSKMSKQSQKEDKQLLLEEEDEDKAMTRNEQTLPQPSKAPMPPNSGKGVPNSILSNPIPPNVPFPSRFIQSKKEESEKDIFETFIKVQVNIPLLDAIKHVPKYAEFLKKLCTTKKRIPEKKVVHVSENVSTILQRKLPSKCKDPGSFTIHCVIGNTRFEHVMLDLSASINIMPYSVYAFMNLGELKNDGVIIQLADQSNAYLKEVLEDVLVQVDHLIFPTYFYVLEMEDSTHSTPLPILLRRPFMKTTQTKIDVSKGALTMEFDGDVINFNVSEFVKYPNDVHSCFAINVIKNIGQEHLTPIKKDVFKTTIENGIGVDHTRQAIALKAPKAESTTFEIVDSASTFESSSQYIGDPSIPIPISTNRLLPSLVQVLNRIQDGGRIYIDFRKLNATIRNDHYPPPFIDPMHGSFKEHVMDDVPLYVVGPNED